jgi:hypothetical protein
MAVVWELSMRFLVVCEDGGHTCRQPRAGPVHMMFLWNLLGAVLVGL